MSKPPALRSFNIQKDDQGNEIQVSISETPGLKAENLGFDTWGSSYVLANLLWRWKGDALRANAESGKNADDVNGDVKENSIPVLELGAGTSLVGISAAAVWGLEVIVTDLEPLMLGLAQNISVNQRLLSESRTRVRCGTLDWSQPSQLHIYPTGETISTSTTKANIILAADTVYAEDHPELLSQTVETCLARTREARVVMCYVLRYSYIEIVRGVWQGFEGLGLECVEEGRRDAEPEVWDDVEPFEWCVWRWKEDVLEKERQRA